MKRQEYPLAYYRDYGNFGVFQRVFYNHCIGVIRRFYFAIGNHSHQFFSYLCAIRYQHL